MEAAIAIISRWLHVSAAAVLIGGVFAILLVLPAALKRLDEPQRQTALAGWRRALRRTVHIALAVLLISGTYNTVVVWGLYKSQKAVLHALWGTHVLLALLALGAALLSLAGDATRPWHRKWITATLVLLLATAAMASGTKWARDRAQARTSEPARLP